MAARARMGVLAVILLVVLAGIRWRSTRESSRSIAVPPMAASSSLAVDDLRANRGVPLRVEPPPVPPMTELPPTLRVSPADPSSPDPVDPVSGPPETATAPLVDPQEPLQVTGGAGGAGGDVDPFLRARVFVHPEIPAVVSKKRIRGTVRMQPRVGIDGRVLEVRVVSSIRNCPECTQAAVAAAQRLIYDAPVGGPVWAAVIAMEFDHNRR